MENSLHLSQGIAFLGGLLTVLSPCVLPILPIIIGRSLQSHRFGPLTLVTGLVGGFAVAGSLLGFTASWFTSLSNGLRIFAIILLIFLGLLAIFPAWSYRFFQRVPFIQNLKEPKRMGLMGEFWLGTQLGLLWTPCAGPVLAGILVLAAAQHQVMSALGLLIIFGMGAAVPLLAIAYGGQTLSRKLLTLRSQSVILQKVGGVMVLGTAISILLGWDVQVQLWLAPFFPKLPF